jgi:prophage regulatory protein
MSATASTLPDKPYLSRREICAVISVSARTLRAWAADGRFPRPLKLGSNCWRWKTADVERWLREKEDCKV